jgi:hypothetical protein
MADAYYSAQTRNIGIRSEIGRIGSIRSCYKIETSSYICFEFHQRSSDTLKPTNCHDWR